MTLHQFLDYADLAILASMIVIIIIILINLNEMRKILKEIQTGAYAQEFLLENKTGATKLGAMRRIGREHQIEIVGGKLREMMPWIKANRLVDKSKN